ncbi:MAG: acyl-CoA dehydrogenase family protein [Mycobacteriaceae bacterium]|nr:acyl-CoA dehydrogenase family protein [Mycobacteriaceae bacterium]
MDFSRVALSDEDQAFLDRTRDFLTTHVTEDVHRHELETGDGFNVPLHLAMGADGWLTGEMNAEDEGGFTPVQRRIWELEKRRVDVPWETWGTTRMVALVVRAYGSPDVRDEVLPKVLRGEVRFCLGYTEPEGGSDIATCKTRAVRDGDGWIINGSKIFTTGAHNCQYVFLLTNTDPEAPKHKSLTMFLVPLTTPGIEIQGIRTVDGDRTNIVYYSDVRVEDKYRLGDVNGGWKVLSGPLAAEHGDTAGDGGGLSDIAVMAHHGLIMAEVVDEVTIAASRSGADGKRPLDDHSVRYRLGRGFARLEAALSTPGIFGRVAVAQTMRDVAGDLMDVFGADSALPVGTEGAVAHGGAEHLYRYAPLTGIYGGTVEVFRNMIAQHALGLPRPNYSAPKAATVKGRQ